MVPLTKEKKGAVQGLYKEVEAEDKTQKKKREFRFTSEKRLCFIDKAVKDHKIIPGVGRYEKVEHGFNKLSSGPKSMSRKRT
jgi:hypothetical protein